MLFGLGLAEWITIIALVASIPLTLKLMARASAAYERKATEREAAKREPTKLPASEEPAERN